MRLIGLLVMLPEPLVRSSAFSLAVSALTPILWLGMLAAHPSRGRDLAVGARKPNRSPEACKACPKAIACRSERGESGACGPRPRRRCRPGPAMDRRCRQRTVGERVAPPGSKRRRSRWTSETWTAGVAKCQVWVAVLRLRSAVGGRGHRLRVQMRAGEGASRLGDGGCRSRIGCCAAYRSGVRMAFPQGYLVRERPPKGRGRGVNFHLAPNPY